MASKAKVDTFANVAAIQVSEAVAGTTAYAKFAFPFSIMDKMAILVSRIEYWFGSLNQLNSSFDAVYAALLAGSSIVNINNQADPVMIDSCAVQRIDIGTAASGFFNISPIIKDFSDLPGSGLLMAPSPLYAAVQSTGAGGVMNCWMRLYYTYMELATDEYWQLVESRRIISN